MRRKPPQIALSLVAGTAAAAAFDLAVAPARTSAFVMWGLLLALAAGIAFFANRICWWILTVYSVAALVFGVWIVWSTEIAARFSWPSWVNFGLQGVIVALLLSPRMIRFVRPLARTNNVPENAG